MNKCYSLWYIEEIIKKLGRYNNYCEDVKFTPMIQYGGIKQVDERKYYIEKLRGHIREIRETLRKKTDFKGINYFYNTNLTDMEQYFSFPDTEKEEILNYIKEKGISLASRSGSLHHLISLLHSSDLFTFLDYFTDKQVNIIAGEQVKETVDFLLSFHNIYVTNSDPFMIKLYKNNIETTKILATKNLKNFYNLKDEGTLFLSDTEEQEQFLDFFEEKLLKLREKELASILSYCYEIELYFKDKDKNHLDNAIDLVYKVYSNSTGFQILYNTFLSYRDKLSLQVSYPLKTEEPVHISRKLDLINNVSLFSVLSSEEMEKLAVDIKMKRYEKDTVLFLEGDRAEDLYIIKSGKVNIYTIFDNGLAKDLVTLQNGDILGEIGVIPEIPRTFSAKISSDKAELYIITRRDFLYMLRKYPSLNLNLLKIICNRIEKANNRLLKYFENYSLYIKDRILNSRKKNKIVASLPLFNVLSQEEIDRVSSKFKFKRYEQSDVLFNEGEKADFVYIIKSGDVALYRKSNDLVTLREGDIFGEVGVISGSCHSLSAKVISNKAELYIIYEDDFINMVGKYPALGINLAEILCNRIAETDRRFCKICNKTA